MDTIVRLSRLGPLASQWHLRKIDPSGAAFARVNFLHRLSLSMEVLHSDGQLMQWGGHLHLAHLDVGWCVVGPGYICSVMDAEEGNAIMVKLKAEGEQRGIAIEYEQ